MNNHKCKGPYYQKYYFTEIKEVDDPKHFIRIVKITGNPKPIP